MDATLQKGIIKSAIVIIIALFIMVKLYRGKARIASLFILFFVLILSYGLVGNIFLRYFPYDEVVGITNGYKSGYRNSGSLHFYYYYKDKEYTSTTSGYDDIDKITKKNGRYIVRVSKKFPEFSEMDFNKPVIGD